jgi:hypothetical protein
VLIKTGSLWCSQAAAEINHAVSEVTRKIAELLGTLFVQYVCIFKSTFQHFAMHNAVPSNLDLWFFKFGVLMMVDSLLKNLRTEPAQIHFVIAIKAILLYLLDFF